MANKKARAKRQAAVQREARERRREVDRELEVRRARTSAGTAASRADGHPDIRSHDAAVLPLIRELREANATWSQIAAWLDERAVSPPGRRGGYKSGRWAAMAVWRIAKRHDIV